MRRLAQNVFLALRVVLCLSWAVLIWTRLSIGLSYDIHNINAVCILDIASAPQKNIMEAQHVLVLVHTGGNRCQGLKTIHLVWGMMRPQPQLSAPASCCLSDCRSVCLSVCLSVQQGAEVPQPWVGPVHPVSGGRSAVDRADVVGGVFRLLLPQVAELGEAQLLWLSTKTTTIWMSAWWVTACLHPPHG